MSSMLPPPLARALAAASSGRLQEAIGSVRTRLRVSPGDAQTLGVLAFLLMQSGDLDGAVTQFERAVRRSPMDAHAHANLAGALFHQGRFRDAEASYRRALTLCPDYLPALAGIVMAKVRLDDIDGAVAAADAGLLLRPGSADILVNRSFALLSAARVTEATTSLEQAATAAPANRRIQAALAFASNYLSLDASEFLTIHRRYGAIVDAPPPARPRPRDAAAPITVGILSSDLKSHSVGYFLLPALRSIPAGFRAICLSSASARPGDPVAAELRAASDGWIDATAMDDAALDRVIRDSAIDVILELNGHSLGSRLQALDRRPAAAIVAAIGYPNTSGHPAVGWRIVDSTTDPPGSDSNCTERLLRIDPCFLCYSPPTDAPKPSLPPSDQPLTFGSFNHAAKIQDETAEAWGRLMSDFPGARLLLKSQTLKARAASETILSRLERHGVSRDRVEIVTYTDTVEEHLSLYSRMHVALDTMPYNGTTTTCEALWMGVPVVTIEGSRHAARVSSSLLRAAGCPELVAQDAAAFCEIARQLVSSESRIAEYRFSLRDRMSKSPLMDAQRYAQRFFGALRHAWESEVGRGPTPEVPA
jgi:protein O-GlcNAc transferase